MNSENEPLITPHDVMLLTLRIIYVMQDEDRGDLVINFNMRS